MCQSVSCDQSVSVSHTQQLKWDQTHNFLQLEAEATDELITKQITDHMLKNGREDDVSDIQQTHFAFNHQTNEKLLR